MAWEFEDNIIPTIGEAAFGNVTFVSKKEEYEYNEENKRTGVILGVKVDVSSTYQESAVTVVVPPENIPDLEELKFGDPVEIEEPVFRAWAMIPENSRSNFADSDIKVRAKWIRKKGGLRQNLNQNAANGQEKAAEKKEAASITK